MTDKLLAEISKKLNVLIALSLRGKAEDSIFQFTGKKKGIGQQVRFLASLGLDAKEIADIVGSPVTSVRTLLTPTRRR